MMNTGRKLATAARIIRYKGLFAFIESLKYYFKKHFGSYRPDESRIVFKVLNPLTTKGLMIDVGAHHGSALAPFAERGWTVFAFEPDAKNRAKLLQVFGSTDNVIIDSRAVADQFQKQATLYRSELSTGISGLSSFHSSHQAADHVEVITLKHFFDEQDITDEEITFLKVDTEGFDLHVLRGFPWERSSPRMILCEFEDAKTRPLGYTMNDLADFLIEHGYRLLVSEWYPIEEYGGLHAWRRFTTFPFQLEDARAWGNIFATQEEAVYEALLRYCKADG